MTRQRRFPIRLKLTVGILAPLFAAIFVCWLTGASIINSRIYEQARLKARTDLNTAREVYNSEIDHIRDVVKFSGQTPYTAAAIDSESAQALENILSPLLHNEKLDFLDAVDAYGRVLFRSANPSRAGERLYSLPLIKQALEGKVASGSMVIPYEQAITENPALADRLVISIKTTPMGRTYSKRLERSGLFLVAAAPVMDSRGAIVGALYGGMLLNGDHGLVDKIKKIIYEGELFEGKNLGTSTIFLNDLRISTNVMTQTGERAIGTQMSEEVYQHVLLRGERWTGRAFVVNDWFFSAYEPIRDPQGQTIGALYVGMRENPYLKIQTRINLIYAGVLFFGSITGIALAWHLGSRLSRPVRELETVARRIAAGERGLPIPARTRDEIGDLANQFSAMTSSLVQREEDISRLNQDLEKKVRERTAELEEKNVLLLQAQEELVRAEKLAAVGELAAGVAHEINNPMAIIRGNAELIQLGLAEGEPNREEADTIVRHVSRVERIVANLLTFARQQAKNPGKVALQPILDDIIRHIGHQLPLDSIKVEREYATDLPELEADDVQIRQVFTNLIVNAIQAMADGGVLTLRTMVHGDVEKVAVEISDTGCGIAPENLKKIFTPFHTTKPAGTGLGLSVSYGIVKDHGGAIEVRSEPGKGATFRVVLPVLQPDAAAPAINHLTA